VTTSSIEWQRVQLTRPEYNTYFNLFTSPRGWVFWLRHGQIDNMPAVFQENKSSRWCTVRHRAPENSLYGQSPRDLYHANGRTEISMPTSVPVKKKADYKIRSKEMMTSFARPVTGERSSGRNFGKRKKCRNRKSKKTVNFALSASVSWRLMVRILAKFEEHADTPEFRRFFIRGIIHQIERMYETASVVPKLFVMLWEPAGTSAGPSGCKYSAI